ncbi:MAG: lipopolysaccharide biosynthesis protein [Verrucomicrobia bacterium]|nr:lipopolysaccharide biosynthesis protein [Verrucomicrobiota bacterium]
MTNQLVNDNDDGQPGTTNALLGDRLSRTIPEATFARINPDQLKGKSVRGGMLTLINQAVSFVLQTVSTVVLARLLSPKDFGLQGMVIAMTGVLGLFRDLGLGAATIQREEITHKQLSTLFWINVAVGVGLTTLGMALAPALVVFYGEPRLFWITIFSASAFLLNSVSMQHGALLVRDMRYGTIAKINISSVVFSSALGIAMAARGFGYWSLVMMALCSPCIQSFGLWFAVPWRPGKPSRGCGVRSMLHFGGTVTLNQLVVYVGYNAEKVLLGRFWGAAALGLYGRAYQLLNLPLQQLYNSMHSVAFPALSRIQSDTERLCRSFLKGYSVLLSLSIPVTLVSALFSDELIKILLGPKWVETGPILWLLTPAIIVFAMINPFGWFLIATGRAGRSLKMALVISPTVILGIALGMRYGPKGVAVGYSAAMCTLLVPILAWAIHDTGITARTYWQASRKPLLAGLFAAACGLAFKMAFGALLPAIPRLILGLGIVFSVYLGVLLVVMKQAGLYRDLINQIFQRTLGKETKPV